jgi:hypothetical protein
MNQTGLTRPAQEASFILEGTLIFSPSISFLDPFSKLLTDNAAGFDLKFDALKSYLDGFKTVINQHATLINQLTSNKQSGPIKTDVDFFPFHHHLS